MISGGGSVCRFALFYILFVVGLIGFVAISANSINGGVNRGFGFSAEFIPSMPFNSECVKIGNFPPNIKNEHVVLNMGGFPFFIRGQGIVIFNRCFAGVQRPGVAPLTRCFCFERGLRRGVVKFEIERTVNMVRWGLSVISNRNFNMSVGGNSGHIYSGNRNIGSQSINHSFLRNANLGSIECGLGTIGNMGVDELGIYSVILSGIKSMLLLQRGIHPADLCAVEAPLIVNRNGGKDRNDGGSGGDNAIKPYEPPSAWVYFFAFGVGIIIFVFHQIYFLRFWQKYDSNSSNPPNPQYPKAASQFQPPLQENNGGSDES